MKSENDGDGIRNKKRLHFALFCVLVLWGVSVVLMFDYISVPNKRDNHDWILGVPEIEDKSRFWEFCIGNGFMSNIEHILFIGCGFFGFLRLYDAMRLWELL